MHILVINGPNLNLLGEREPEIYGTDTYKRLEKTLLAYGEQKGVMIEIKQTNLEGIIIDLLHYAHFKHHDAVILNPAAYTHYAYAIRDAIKAINVPVVEVHLSDPKKRPEPWRHRSVVEDVCVKTFKGKGIRSYKEAIDYLVEG